MRDGTDGVGVTARPATHAQAGGKVRQIALVGDAWDWRRNAGGWGGGGRSVGGRKASGLRVGGLNIGNLCIPAKSQPEAQSETETDGEENGESDEDEGPASEAAEISAGREGVDDAMKWAW